MKSTLVQSGEFTYTAVLRPLTRPVDHFSLVIQSTWGYASEPNTQPTLFQLTTDAAGLVALRVLIDQAVSPATA